MKIYNDIKYIIRFNNSVFFMYNYGGIYNLQNNTRQKIFNLQDPIEKQLARIYSFYEVLNGVENPVGEILYGTVTVLNNVLVLEGGEEMGDYTISNESDDIGIPEKDEVYFGAGVDLPVYEISNEENDFELNSLTYKEFYLLMQIYFGLYEEKELKNKLEEKEKNGEYEEIKKILNNDGWENKYKGIDRYRNFVKDYLSQAKVQEYLKLELMRKDTSGAFAELNIKKIYDKDWSEEEQKKCVEEVNKEFGEEVIIEE